MWNVWLCRQEDRSFGALFNSQRSLMAGHVSIYISGAALEKFYLILDSQYTYRVDYYAPGSEFPLLNQAKCYPAALETL